eukprot:scaffold14730_cov78-Skeletonema_dohrnii-CCMP3373.AAC.2
MATASSARDGRVKKLAMCISGSDGFQLPAKMSRVCTRLRTRSKIPEKSGGRSIWLNDVEESLDAAEEALRSRLRRYMEN